MFVAIDIGGTKTEVAFYENQLLSSLKSFTTFPTNQIYDYELKRIIEIIEQRMVGKKIKSISISFPGIVDLNGKIIQASNILDYTNKELKKDLLKIFQTSIFITQDSTCSALAECIYGKIQNYSKIVHLIMGTGLGSTLIENKNDSLVISPFEACGMIVDFQNGRRHNINKTLGLLEAYVGGGSVEAFYGIKLSKVKDENEIWEDLTNYLAVGINNINCILKPEIIVIGGGIGSKRKIALESIKFKAKQFAEFVNPPEIQFTEVAGNSSLIGALAVNFIENLELNS